MKYKKLRNDIRLRHSHADSFNGKAGLKTSVRAYAEAGKPFKTLEKSFGVTALSDYSGVSAENSAPENVKTPFIFRYIVMLFNKLFGMISK